MPPDIRYARTSSGAHVAYCVQGEGPPVVFCGPMEWSLEWAYENPTCVRFLDRLAEFSRLIVFDKRGSGHSDRLLGTELLDERAEDITAVMDATLTDRATVFGSSEGGSLALQFTSAHPERVTSLITFGTIVRAAGRPEDGVPFVAIPELVELWPDMTERSWGTGKNLLGMPMPGPEARFSARWQQLCASPAAARVLAELDSRIDVRPLLSSIRVPTLVIHRGGDVFIGADHGRYISANIEGARYLELPGEEHTPWRGDPDRLVAEVQEFVTGVRPVSFSDRVVATVMFADIASSTEHAARVGDDRWKDLMGRHDRLVRERVEWSGGRFVQATGDGFVATFDGASRAIRCGKEVIDAIAELGVATRVGLHTGEIELGDQEIRGIAVHIAERVAKAGEPGQVWLSRTVRDLADGSGIVFEDCGDHELKGVPDRWRLYRAKIT